MFGAELGVSMYLQSRSSRRSNRTTTVKCSEAPGLSRLGMSQTKQHNVWVLAVNEEAGGEAAATCGHLTATMDAMTVRRGSHTRPAAGTRVQEGGEVTGRWQRDGRTACGRGRLIRRRHGRPGAMEGGSRELGRELLYLRGCSKPRGGSGATTQGSGLLA